MDSDPSTSKVYAAEKRINTQNSPSNLKNDADPAWTEVVGKSRRSTRAKKQCEPLIEAQVSEKEAKKVEAKDRGATKKFEAKDLGSHNKTQSIPSKESKIISDCEEFQQEKHCNDQKGLDRGTDFWKQRRGRGSRGKGRGSRGRGRGSGRGRGKSYMFNPYPMRNYFNPAVNGYYPYQDGYFQDAYHPYPRSRGYSSSYPPFGNQPPSYHHNPHNKFTPDYDQRHRYSFDDDFPSIEFSQHLHQQSQQNQINKLKLENKFLKGVSLSIFLIKMILSV